MEKTGRQVRLQGHDCSRAAVTRQQNFSSFESPSNLTSSPKREQKKRDEQGTGAALWTMGHGMRVGVTHKLLMPRADKAALQNNVLEL